MSYVAYYKYFVVEIGFQLLKRIIFKPVGEKSAADLDAFSISLLEKSLLRLQLLNTYIYIHLTACKTEYLKCKHATSNFIYHCNLLDLEARTVSHWPSASAPKASWEAFDL